MISVRIITSEAQGLKYGAYIKELSDDGSWFYPTKNDLVLLQRSYGTAFLHIAETKKELDAFKEDIQFPDKKYEIPRHPDEYYSTNNPICHVETGNYPNIQEAHEATGINRDKIIDELNTKRSDWHYINLD